MVADSDRIRTRYRKLVFFTLFLTFDLILFGAFVRLTDSGLGCPDWPGCYSSLTPIGALSEIRQAAETMPFGPVTLAKAWIEMIHRYIGAFLGLMIIVLLYMAWRYRRQLGQSPWLATVLFAGVCLQGAFGAWTVTLRLMPAVVTAHLLGGMLLLALLTWLSTRVKPHAPIPPAAARWWPLVALGSLLLLVQIALGGWVSTNYAALACLEFPTCHGQLVPEMDFRGGFSVMRGLGELPSGEIISQHALTAIHWTHRKFAFVVAACLLVIGGILQRYPGLQQPARWLIIIVLLQFATGLATIFLQWPLLLAVVHNGGAAVLVILMTTLLVRTVGADRPAPQVHS
mgnify:CR=1 FL=1